PTFLPYTTLFRSHPVRKAVGRHRGKYAEEAPGRRRRRRRRRGGAIAALATALVIAIGAVVAGIHVIDRVDGCTGSDLTLDVAVAPEMAPAVDAIATDFNAGEHTVDDECVHVDVRQVDSANVAFGITGSGA